MRRNGEREREKKKGGQMIYDNDVHDSKKRRCSIVILHRFGLKRD